MSVVLFIAVCIAALVALAMLRSSLWGWALFAVVVTLALQAGIPAGHFHPIKMAVSTYIGWIPAALMLLLAIRPFRRVLVTRPAFGIVKKNPAPRFQDRARGYRRGHHRLRFRVVFRSA